jgi:hypothetical protein
MQLFFALALSRGPSRSLAAGDSSFDHPSSDNDRENYEITQWSIVPWPV